jgi:hypothetical protein
MYGESNINKVFDNLWLLIEMRKREKVYFDRYPSRKVEE